MKKAEQLSTGQDKADNPAPPTNEQQETEILKVQEGYITIDPSLKGWLEKVFVKQLATWGLSVTTVKSGKAELLVVTQLGKVIRIVPDEKYHEGIKAQTENFLRALDKELAKLNHQN